MKLLLHTCCGPCFLGVWKELGDHEDIDTDIFYYNPNIHPAEEYEKRLDSLKTVTASKKLNLLVGDYNSQDYYQVIPKTKSEFPQRCPYCYLVRLEKTAKEAKALGYDAFSTTLLVSPYQNHEELVLIGRELAEKYGLEFYYTDWRPYFREGQNEAKNAEIYRQKYCGCSYSLEESKKR